ALARLDRRLWLPAIVNTEGAIVGRLDTLADWRERLLDGEAPMRRDDRSPGPDLAAALSTALTLRDLPALARRRGAVTDQILRSLLWHLDRIAALAARVGRVAAVQACAEAFVDDWTTEAADMKAVLRMFESLDGFASVASWSQVRGLLRDDRWQAVLDT